MRAGKHSVTWYGSRDGTPGHDGITSVQHVAAVAAAPS